MKKNILFLCVVVLGVFASCNDGNYLATNYTFINLEVGDSVLLETYNVKYVDGIEGIHYCIHATDKPSEWDKETIKDTICTLSNTIGKNTMVYGEKPGDAYIVITYKRVAGIAAYMEGLIVPVHVSEQKGEK